MRNNKNVKKTKANTPQLSPTVFSESLRSRNQISHQFSQVKHVKIYRNTAYQSFLGEISLARKDEQHKILDWVQHNMIKGIYSNWNRLAPVILHYFRKHQPLQNRKENELFLSSLTEQLLLKNLQCRVNKQEASNQNILFQYDIPNKNILFISEEQKFKRTKENLNIIMNILTNFFKNKSIIKNNKMIRKMIEQYQQQNVSDIDIQKIAITLHQRAQLFNLLIDYQLMMKEGPLYEALQQPFKDLNLTIQTIKSKSIGQIKDILSKYFVENVQLDLPKILQANQKQILKTINNQSLKQKQKIQQILSTGNVSPTYSINSTPTQTKKLLSPQTQRQLDHLQHQIPNSSKLDMQKKQIYQVQHHESQSNSQSNKTKNSNNERFIIKKNNKQFNKTFVKGIQRQRKSVEKAYKTRVFQKNGKEKNDNDPAELISKSSEERKTVRSGRFNSINVQKYRASRSSEQIQNLCIKLYEKNNFIFSRNNRMKRRKIKVSQLQAIDIDKILQQLPVKKNKSKINENYSIKKIQSSEQRSSKQLFKKIKIESKRRSYRPTTNISSFSKQNNIKQKQTINNKMFKLKDKRRKGRYQQQKTFLQNENLQQLFQQIENQVNFIKKGNLIKRFFIKIIKEGYFDRPQLISYKQRALRFVQLNSINKNQIRFSQNINFNRNSSILNVSQPHQSEIIPFLRILRAGIISQQIPKLATIVNKLKRPQDHILDQDWAVKIRASLSQQKLQQKQFITKLLGKENLLLNFANKMRRKYYECEIGQKSI